MFVFIVVPLLSLCSASPVSPIQAKAVGLPGDEIVAALAPKYDFPEITIQNAVSGAFSKAAASEGLPTNDLACTRDYSKSCPIGWSFDGVDGCTAPEKYDGACPPTLKLGGMTPVEKSKKAAKCGTEFPCLGACIEDFEGDLCPVGWDMDIDGWCVAGTTYSGKCVRRKRFVGWSAAAKESWAAECGLTFPCKAPMVKTIPKCKPGFNSHCPDGWKMLGGLCRAPQDYTGQCSLSLDLSGLRDSEKLLVAEACGAEFCS